MRRKSTNRKSTSSGPVKPSQNRISIRSGPYTRSVTREKSVGGVAQEKLSFPKKVWKNEKIEKKKEIDGFVEITRNSTQCKQLTLSRSA